MAEFPSISKELLQQSIESQRPTSPSSIISPLEAASPKIPSRRSEGATYGLSILFFISTLNYFDRYIPSAVKQELEGGLHLNDAQTAYPVTGFLIVYMVFSPIFAHLSDQGFHRRRLIAAGVFLWSLSTAAAAICTNFGGYLASRAFVGIGEAAAVTISPTLICDYYPPEERNKVFAIFSMSTPLGAGLGYIVGGYLGQYLGWRASFVICGLPGIACSLLVLTINDPGRGIFDPVQLGVVAGWKETAIFLAHSQRYVWLGVGYILAVFAVGGLSDWAPTYVERSYGISPSTSGLIVGAITIIATPIGVFVGVYLANKYQVILPNANLFISGIGLFVASIVSFAVFTVSSVWASCILLFIAECFLWWYSAPWNTEIALCVPHTMRARAYGIAIFFRHRIMSNLFRH